MSTYVSNKKSGYLLPLIAISFLLLGAAPSMGLIINTNTSGATVTLSGQSPGATQYSITPAAYPSSASVRLTKWSYVPSSYNTRPLSSTTPLQPLADNPPSVLATSSPASPTTSNIVTITASATDDKGLSSITVYVDGAAKRTCRVSRLSKLSKTCSYASTFSAGTHSYYATAKDNAGHTSTLAQRSFTVSAPAPPQPIDNPPSVFATSSPASPTTASTVTITASATDDKGLSMITIYADNVAKKSCTVSGISSTCSYAATYAAGTHNYYATVNDTASKTATSSTKQFTVSTASTTDNPPAVSVAQTPTNPTTTTIVTITAPATDDKGLSSITVYADGAAKKTCTVSGTSNSCSYASAFSAGTHSYYATAKDNAGQTSTSAQRSFTVSAPAPAPQPTPLYQSITTGNPTYDKYDNLIIKYSTKYNMPDPMIIKAQIYQESYFDDMGVNPENACGVSTINGKPIDKSYAGVDSMVNPAWSLGSMQESRSCVNSFLTNADGSFNNTLWHDSNYKFDFYLNDWMNNANGPGNPSFNNFKQRFPGCNAGKLTLMTVALWNNGNDYNSCNDPINNLNYYTSDVLNHYYEMAKMANYIPLYDYNAILSG